MGILEHLLAERGFFSRAEALDAGTSDATLTAGVRARVWVRFCHGYYTDAARWSALGAEGRHLLRADAALHQLRDAVALSHVTGSLNHGLGVWGLDLSSAHVTRLDGATGRRNNHLVHHRGAVGPEEVTVVRGRPVLSPVRCAVETATLGSGESGLVVLDSLLHQGLCSPADLRAEIAAKRHWPDTLPLQLLARMASPGGESVGESRLRWLLKCAGLPDPVLQYEVRAGDTLIGRCDMAWPELGVILEFDGRFKYQRHVAPGLTPGDVVFAEKQREDRIRELTGFLVVRVVWSDLDRPNLLVQRIREAFARQALLRAG
ncbi:hypothetical protein [Nocardioides sp. CFH 31398]|uniref:hypothetical protein n=1 Tax=Nocardioides sp. CFH 31398 TaxID=2919579 RepID=UPI001F064EE0|nr:hypothetical protein [Nocardioides sp. CFH 31398]MCH1867864.1 hypothetical protein [Nocardioides sp. CFH 31398]